MKSVYIFAVGRIKEKGLRDLCDDYYRRCSSLIQIKEKEVKDLKSLGPLLPRGALLIALDEHGQQFSSQSFAVILGEWLQGSAQPIVFLIGGADGLGSTLLQQVNFTVSLGKMTYAHRLVRVVWAEQIYRAISIIQGTPYHRE